MTRRAAIYARVSTGEQTPENQIRVLREVSDRAGWTVSAEYVETASGATAKRAGLERMLADAARRKFDTLLCWDVSRLGRSLRDLVEIFETLRALKIDLVNALPRWADPLSFRGWVPMAWPRAARKRTNAGTGPNPPE